MSAKLYAGSDASGILLASCDSIEIQVMDRYLGESFKDQPDAFTDRSVVIASDIAIVVSGRIEDIVSIHTLRQRSIEPVLYPYFLLYANGGSWQADFGLENWSEGLRGGQEERFSVRLVSHRTPVYTAP